MLKGNSDTASILKNITMFFKVLVHLERQGNIPKTFMQLVAPIVVDLQPNGSHKD